MAREDNGIIIGVSIDSKRAQAQLKEFETKYSKTSEIQTKVTLKGGIEAIKIVRQYKNELDGTTVSTQQFARADGKVGAVLKENGQIFKTNHEIITKINKSTKQARQEIDEASKSVANFNNVSQQAHTSTNNLDLSFRSLGETLVKVAKFKIVTEALMAFIQVGNEALEIVKDFDNAMVEFVKVSDLSGDALDEYAQKLGELGEITMKSRTQMLESATEFVKSGYSEEQSADLATVATMFQNVADSELSAGDSASYVISQMKAFGYTTTEEAQSIIDKTNEVRFYLRPLKTG